MAINGYDKRVGLPANPGPKPSETFDMNKATKNLIRILNEYYNDEYED